MTELNKNVLELIKQNKSMKEMCSILNISEKQLYISIKYLISYGYQMKLEYCYNSDIQYKLKKELINNNSNEINIKMPNSVKDFRCIVISDIHIGNFASNLDYLKRVYEYASKNSISVILICGDMLEGSYSSDKKNISNIYNQIETLIKKYPYDKNINNFGILGNHDYHFVHYDGLDVMKKITDSRYDIVLLGYGDGLIKVSNDSILLKHNLCVIENQEMKNDAKIVLTGHGHLMKTKIYDRLNICVPTISNVCPDKTQTALPGFIDMKISLEKGNFAYLSVHHMAITPNIVEASQTRCKIKNMFEDKYDYSKRKK